VLKCYYFISFLSWSRYFWNILNILYMVLFVVDNMHPFLDRECLLPFELMSSFNNLLFDGKQSIIVPMFSGRNFFS